MTWRIRISSLVSSSPRMNEQVVTGFALRELDGAAVTEAERRAALGDEGFAAWRRAHAREVGTRGEPGENEVGTRWEQGRRAGRP